MIRRVFGWLLTAGLLVTIWQHQAIIDWWVLSNYEAPSDIAALSRQTSMTGAGRRLFYLGTPELNDKPTFNTNCPVVERRASLVLGCYSGSEIYILRVERKELDEVMPVTAAHEMLHVAYGRLDEDERAEVEELIKDFYPSIEDQKFQDLIAEYKSAEPGQLLNELHSLLPTQIGQLPAELEDYYSRYFEDRQKVVDLFLEYESVFENINQQRQQLVADISSLRQRIETLESQIQDAANEASQLAEQINQLRAQGEFEESNELVPAQNAAADQARSLTLERNALAAEHNQKVERVNGLALIAQDLFDSLDSSVQTPVN